MAFHHLEFRHKNICEAWGNRLARKGRVYVHLYIQRGLVEVSIHAWCDFFCWESSLRFVRFFLLDLIEERAGLCVRKKREGRGGGGGREWRVVPWSVFPQVLCNPVLKLEPCGNKHVQVHFMCSAWKVNWGDKLQAATVTQAVCLAALFSALV